MGTLDGKICLVTAAGQGIGRSITERFLREGARVLATDIDLGKLAGLDRLDGAACEVLDVTDEQAVSAMAFRFPDVEVLVNCAGWVANGPLLACDLGAFRRSFTLNVESMFLTCKAFVPAMVARGQGSIINIASVASSVMAAPDRFAYGTSKAAVIGLTMAIARDYAASGIRCNAISPGTVDTPSLHDRMAATGDAAASRRAFVGRQLMGRLGEADEIAAVAALLAGDEAKFMTGSNVVIDGGMSL
jgi:NAD(P)-dependent dehydrogenase (short-subunit alcohol dehydrogenase family)